MDRTKLNQAFDDLNRVEDRPYHTSLVKDFSALAQQMVETCAKKNADYARGGDPFKNLRRHGQYGIVVRLDDKISRLDSLTNPAHQNQTAAVNESLEDTALDVAVYAILLILLGREKK